VTSRRLCRDRGLFADTLDIVKFICKDIWIILWDKQVDNLRTNHRVRFMHDCHAHRCPNHRHREFMFFKTTNSDLSRDFRLGRVGQKVFVEPKHMWRCQLASSRVLLQG